ncbi:MAG: class I SAM-dependent methyltransferase [Caldilineaceae bacterium]|nr:class I SAM-dependent methyltransferase [Caldilineaceae bacterium]
METLQYYDPMQNRLIYVGEEATPAFWDTQWQAQMPTRQTLSTIKETLVTRVTRRYLKPEEGVILEGGCGKGHHVAALTNHGYECIGIDFAEQTVDFLHKTVPQLDIRLGDVHALPFADNTFMGYWSLGVIEHFWEGYTRIAQEIQRVLKPEGYLFITFPYMSRLRQYKARHGAYPIYTDTAAPPGFYQFALDHRRVLERFATLGFACVQVIPQGGLLGIKNEATRFKASLRQLYDYRGRSPLLRGSRYLVEQFSLPLAAHSILLVLRLQK